MAVQFALMSSAGKDFRPLMQARLSVVFCIYEVHILWDESNECLDKSCTDDILCPVMGSLTLAHVWDACASTCEGWCPAVSLSGEDTCSWKLLEKQCATGLQHGCYEDACLVARCVKTVV